MKEEYIHHLANEYVEEYIEDKVRISYEFLLCVVAQQDHERIRDALADVNLWTRFVCGENLDPEQYLFWLDENWQLKQGFDEDEKTIW